MMGDILLKALRRLRDSTSYHVGGAGGSIFPNGRGYAEEALSHALREQGLSRGLDAIVVLP